MISQNCMRSPLPCECDGSVAAHGAVAVIVDEEHSDVRVRQVGPDQHGAVHVVMAARLPHQQAPVDVQVRAGVRALLQEGGARGLGEARLHDPHWLPARVHLCRADLDLPRQ